MTNTTTAITIIFLMNVVPLALMEEMMDQKINSAVYVKVLKGTREFPNGHRLGLVTKWETAQRNEKIFDLGRNRTHDFDPDLITIALSRQPNFIIIIIILKTLLFTYVELEFEKNKLFSPVFL